MQDYSDAKYPEPPEGMKRDITEEIRTAAESRGLVVHITDRPTFCVGPTGEPVDEGDDVHTVATTHWRTTLDVSAYLDRVKAYCPDAVVYLLRATEVSHYATDPVVGGEGGRIVSRKPVPMRVKVRWFFARPSVCALPWLTYFTPHTS